MFQNRTIISAVEFGTSKITVLVGESKEDGQFDVIGMGEVPSVGIAKGEIHNMDDAFEQLSLALEEADNLSNGELNNSSMFMIPVTGCGISSMRGTGAVYINNSDKKVTEADRSEAHKHARGQQLDADRTILNSSESYFVIDNRRRVRNPLNQTAFKLEAHVHIIHGLTNRMENYKSVLHESGYEDCGDIVFSPLASSIGVLSEEERESGVLLVDMGAGVTDYMVEFNSGVLYSGMLQIGFDNVINDVAIGLELNIAQCRKLIEDGTLQEKINAKDEYIDIPMATGRVRRIPIASFEAIINSRLREIFTIIRKSINDDAQLAALNSGVVLTGGGALCANSVAMAREVFNMSARTGTPIGLSGAITGLDSPRYSTVYGALKIADYYARMSEPNNRAFKRLLTGVDGVVNKVRQVVDDLKGSFKI